MHIYIKPGTKLVCIRQAWQANYFSITNNIKTPRFNHHYTIREIKKNDGKIYVLLNEIKNPWVEEVEGEMSFNIEGFRLIPSFFPEGHYFDPLFINSN